MQTRGTRRFTIATYSRLIQNHFYRKCSIHYFCKFIFIRRVNVYCHPGWVSWLFCCAVPWINFYTTKINNIKQCCLVITDDVVDYFITAFAPYFEYFYKRRSIFSCIFMIKAFIINTIWISFVAIFSIKSMMLFFFQKDWLLIVLPGLLLLNAQPSLE